MPLDLCPSIIRYVLLKVSSHILLSRAKESKRWFERQELPGFGGFGSLERNSVILPNLGLMRSNNVPKARPTGTWRKGCHCLRWLRLETLDDYDVKIYNGDGDGRSERQGYFRSSAALTYLDKVSTVTWRWSWRY